MSSSWAAAVVVEDVGSIESFVDAGVVVSVCFVLAVSQVWRASRRAFEDSTRDSNAISSSICAGCRCCCFCCVCCSVDE